jgi:glucose-6-phosphate 1-epimerase
LLCCSFASAFNGAGRKPGDKVLLRDEGENDHRQNDQHAGCREPAPVHTRIARVERCHHYRQLRGGIPIIFPWFGASRRALAAPQHGFARTAPWHLDSVETAGRESLTLTFSLGDGDVGSPFWPEPFRAIYTVVFAQTLSLRLAVQNRAAHPIIFEEALHTYFAISDITGITISGLAGTTYIDKSDAARRKPQTAALVTITAETDSVYLDTPEQCAIEDRGWRRRVVIKKDAAASSVVWNPWAEKAAAMVDLGDPAWRGMVCVETGNIADNEVRLPADGEHQMSTAISIDAGP